MIVEQGKNVFQGPPEAGERGSEDPRMEAVIKRVQEERFTVLPDGRRVRLEGWRQRQFLEELSLSWGNGPKNLVLIKDLMEQYGCTRVTAVDTMLKLREKLGGSGWEIEIVLKKGHKRGGIEGYRFQRGEEDELFEPQRVVEEKFCYRASDVAEATGLGKEHILNSLGREIKGLGIKSLGGGGTSSRWRYLDEAGLRGAVSGFRAKGRKRRMGVEEEGKRPSPEDLSYLRRSESRPGAFEDLNSEKQKQVKLGIVTIVLSALLVSHIDGEGEIKTSLGLMGILRESIQGIKLASVVEKGSEEELKAFLLGVLGETLEEFWGQNRNGDLSVIEGRVSTLCQRLQVEGLSKEEVVKRISTDFNI